MNKKIGKNEVWEWYQAIGKFEEAGMGQREYCRSNGLDIKKFANMRYRFIYKKHSDPDTYEKLMELGIKYLNSNTMASKFAKQHQIKLRHLSEICTHIGYLKIIEEIKDTKENAPMKFVQVKHQEIIQDVVQNIELVAQQNDIEIIITKGVKVIISPNIDSMKIIKIIELLKDL